MVAYKLKRLFQVYIYDLHEGDVPQVGCESLIKQKNFNFKKAPTKNMLVKIHYNL